MGTYNFNQSMVEQYAPQVFQMCDRNGSGNLEMHEFPGMCQNFFSMMGMPPPGMFPPGMFPPGMFPPGMMGPGPMGGSE